MVVSTTQLGTYDQVTTSRANHIGCFFINTAYILIESFNPTQYRQAKVSFHQMGLPDGPGLHLLSSLTAGLVYSLASLPLDTAKTRMQTQVGSQWSMVEDRSNRI